MTASDDAPAPLPSPLPSPLCADTSRLTDGSVLFDLTGRGRLEILGPDRVSFLQGVVTNDVKGLAPGKGCDALLLTPKGKLRATMTIQAMPDRLLLDTEPELALPLEAALRAYIVYPPVELANRTEETALLHLEGTGAAVLLASVGITQLPAAAHDHLPFSLAGAPGTISSESRAGFPGFDLSILRDEAASVSAALLAAGAAAGDNDILEVGRIEAGLPRWGTELDGSVLPEEAGLNRTAVSTTKGCYVGQEIVARLKTYGHVNRLLVRLRLPSGSVPARGDAVVTRDGEAPVGTIVSSVESARLGTCLAFAWVKREQAAARLGVTALTRGGAVPAEILAPSVAG